MNDSEREEDSGKDAVNGDLSASDADSDDDDDDDDEDDDDNDEEEEAVDDQFRLAVKAALGDAADRSDDDETNDTSEVTFPN